MRCTKSDGDLQTVAIKVRLLLLAASTAAMNRQDTPRPTRGIVSTLLSRCP
jgi:hypothetical protein